MLKIELILVIVSLILVAVLFFIHFTTNINFDSCTITNSESIKDAGFGNCNQLCEGKQCISALYKMDKTINGDHYSQETLVSCSQSVQLGFKQSGSDTEDLSLTCQCC